MLDRGSPVALPTGCDVVIIGAGPAGLAAATHLKQLGIDDVIIVERESQAGGIPRHCGHPPFGMREFKRCMTGPIYAQALHRRALDVGVCIFLKTSVVELKPGPTLLLSTLDGLAEISAKLVIIATGIRETPRAARLVSGHRPLGIVTTGALQSMVYLQQKIPFMRPVIIGTELVSFSAILTCRHAGIKPLAMIEQNKRITARSIMAILPSLLAIPIELNSRLDMILGKDRVAAVCLQQGQESFKKIACDGVVFTGQFTPEASLMQAAFFDIDPATGGPVVDQYGRCSDPNYLAVGNLLRPVESAGWSWQEGRQMAETCAQILKGSLLGGEAQIKVLTMSPVIQFVMPQRISLPNHGKKMSHFQLRFNQPVNGRLSLILAGKTLWSKNINSLPQRRCLIPIPDLNGVAANQNLEIHFEAS